MPPKGKAEPVDDASGSAGSASRPGPDLARLMPLAGFPVAFWATVPQWSGPKLNVSAATEVADHIAPAVLVVLASIVGVLAGKRAQGPGALRLVAGMAVLLAGLWMVATHLPLVLEATRGQAPWPATIYHTASATAVFGLGLLWSTVTWSEAGDEAQPATEAQE